jgi:hypothetical protein
MPTTATKRASAKKPTKVSKSTSAPDLAATFQALKSVLKPFESRSELRTDKPKDYHLYTRNRIYKGQQIYFAGVKLNKNYVSFYLMTVYSSPKQKALISPALKKRMQGKACFNFTTPDSALMKALSQLVSSGAKAFLDVDQLDVTGMKCD